MNYRTFCFISALLCCVMWATPPQADAYVVDGNLIMDQRMSENLCALTFDDGPSRNTPLLLDTLAEHGIPATFFLLGKQVEQYPDLVRRIVDEGHEVGNHSYSHPNLRLISPSRKAAEIQQTDALLRALGAAPRYLRPPYGTYDRFTVDIAETLGLAVMLWSLDSRDWQRLPADYAQLRTTRGFSYPQGSLRGIFLFHDTHKATVDDLPKIIADLQAGGCSRFVTVSDYLSGMLDPEPGQMMARRSQPAPLEQMPLASRDKGPHAADTAERPMPTAPPFELAPASMPLARCSKPWQPAAETAAAAQTATQRPALSRAQKPFSLPEPPVAPGLPAGQAESRTDATPVS